jgi:hypothetical protein
MPSIYQSYNPKRFGANRLFKTDDQGNFGHHDDLSRQVDRNKTK